MHLRALFLLLPLSLTLACPADDPLQPQPETPDMPEDTREDAAPSPDLAADASADLPESPCPANTPTACGDRCVDTTQDPRACGACERACDAGQACVSGACEAPPTDCRVQGCEPGAWCDPDGACRPGCDSDASCPAGRRCDVEAHMCVCAANLIACGDACLPEDAEHCGPGCATCEGANIGQAACVEGACVRTACNETQTLCDGQCDVCPDGANVAAIGCDGQGQCVATACIEGSKACLGDCAVCPQDPNITTIGCDPQGQCVATACVSDTELCDGACAACPTGPGVMTTGCGPQGQCVATACAAGYASCAQGCCPQGPATAGAISSRTIDAYSFTLDALENAHVVYVATRFSGGLAIQTVYYATWDGVTWAETGIDSWRGDPATDVAIALDAQGYPHVTYDDRGDGTLMYTRFDGVTWSAEEVEPSLASDAHDLALDSMGRPVLTFTHIDRFSTTFPTGVYLSTRTAPSVWTRVRVRGPEGRGLNFALDSQDQAHLTFRDLNTRHVARSAMNTWVETPLQPGGLVDGASSLTLDGLSRPQIAYEKAGSGIAYARFDGTSWAQETVESRRYAAGPSLKLDALGTPHLVYTYASDLHYAQKTNGVWDITLLPTYAKTNDDSLTLDRLGRPHVVYVHNDGNSVELRYTWYDGAAWKK